MPRGREYAYEVSDQDFEFFPRGTNKYLNWLFFFFFNVEIIVGNSGSVTQFSVSQFLCWLS